jgi:heat shock protein HspQ
MNAKFRIGDIVEHARYGYRGVIFGQDPVCTADEKWYQSNHTQPDRNQPWYHVMVDGAEHTTYAAESNLKPDESGQPIEHPLLGQHFPAFFKGRYYTEPLN